MQACHLSRGDLLGCLELIQASLGCETPEQTRALLARVRGLLPHAGAVAALSSSCGPGASPLTALRVVNVDYPDAYLADLGREGLLAHDAVVAENFRSYSLQHWADTMARPGGPPRMREVVSLAGDHGFERTAEGWGYTFGIQDPAAGVGSVFCFAGLPRCERTEEILNLLAPHLHVALRRMPPLPLPPTPAGLTPREVEVLRWAGQGKTNWEISEILGISQRTAKFHVENAIRKLGASTRAHAVAVGLERRLISID